MDINSKNSLHMVNAYKKGYRISNEGYAISYTGKPMKLRISPSGYYVFNARINNILRIIYVHQLQAYQKYGESVFCCFCVRHIDGNKLDNSIENINIGSHSDNMMDIPELNRIKKSSLANVKYTFLEVQKIIEFYNKCKSYKKTMIEFNISSKGTLFYIINKRMFINS